MAIVDGMDADSDVADDDSLDPSRGRLAMWTMAKLVQLLDEAIESAGAQLASSAGLLADWPDDPPETKARRGNQRSRSSLSSAETQLVDPDAGQAARAVEL